MGDRLCARLERLMEELAVFVAEVVVDEPFALHDLAIDTPGCILDAIG
ncbi:MAG: hypothetical protein ACRED0_06985 [Gammaproteobacteria bacterium]